MAALREQVIPFPALDGFQCNLIRVQGDRPSSKGPVLLVHGAGVRANLYRPPVKETLVEHLVAAGYDVWLENWRASIDLAPNRWTLDHAAAYDHPAAVRKIMEVTQADHLKAFIHCQGSTSFMMSAVAGLVPQVKVIVSNAVSLHPVVPWFSEVKINTAVPIVALMTPYLNCQWGLKAEGFVPKMIQALVELTHRECSNPVCKQVSFTYGTGFPALWSHENLNAATHEWLKQEFAHVPLRFFKHMARCLLRGHLVALDRIPGMPDDYTAAAPRTSARFAFLAGEQNLCFRAESQDRTFRYFDKLKPGYHSLRIFPDYGHLDVLLGQNAYRDTFPAILEELERTH